MKEAQTRVKNKIIAEMMNLETQEERGWGTGADSELYHEEHDLWACLLKHLEERFE